MKAGGAGAARAGGVANTGTAGPSKQGGGTNWILLSFRELLNDFVTHLLGRSPS